MKKTLITLSLMAAATSAMADVIDLTGSDFTGVTASGSSYVVENGISESDLFGYSSGQWHATISQSSLTGQAKVITGESGSISMQVGAASPTGKGNWVAVKIDATQIDTEVPQTLSFDWVKDALWGREGYSATFTVKFVGFNADGTATTLNSWSTTLDNSALTSADTTKHVDMTLNETQGEYSSYGVLISAIEDASVPGGCGMTITNLTLQTTPEPTTATLSLLALAGLCARRRRK